VKTNILQHLVFVFQKQVSEAIFPGGPEKYWTVGIGLVATVVAASYVSHLAKEILKRLSEDWMTKKSN
jgi:hypothetical protein